MRAGHRSLLPDGGAADPGGLVAGLIVRHWIAGHNQPCLLLAPTTPDIQMEHVASLLGLTADEAGPTRRCEVVLTGSHVTVRGGELLVEHPVDDLWATTARDHGRVLLSVVLDPLEEGFTTASLDERARARPGSVLIGLAPVAPPS